MLKHTKITNIGSQITPTTLIRSQSVCTNNKISNVNFCSNSLREKLTGKCNSPVLSKNIKYSTNNSCDVVNKCGVDIKPVSRVSCKTVSFTDAKCDKFQFLKFTNESNCNLPTIKKSDSCKKLDIKPILEKTSIKDINMVNCSIAFTNRQFDSQDKPTPELSHFRNFSKLFHNPFKSFTQKFRSSSENNIKSIKEKNPIDFKMEAQLRELVKGNNKPIPPREFCKSSSSNITSEGDVSKRSQTSKYNSIGDFENNESNPSSIKRKSSGRSSANSFTTIIHRPWLKGLPKLPTDSESSNKTPIPVSQNPLQQTSIEQNSTKKSDSSILETKDNYPKIMIDKFVQVSDEIKLDSVGDNADTSAYENLVNYNIFKSHRIRVKPSSVISKRKSKNFKRPTMSFKRQKVEDWLTFNKDILNQAFNKKNLEQICSRERFRSVSLTGINCSNSTNHFNNLLKKKSLSFSRDLTFNEYYSLRSKLNSPKFLYNIPHYLSRTSIGTINSNMPMKRLMQVKPKSSRSIENIALMNKPIKFNNESNSLIPNDKNNKSLSNKPPRPDSSKRLTKFHSTNALNKSFNDVDDMRVKLASALCRAKCIELNKNFRCQNTPIPTDDSKT